VDCRPDPTLFPKWEPSKKKLMKQSTGWSYEIVKRARIADLLDEADQILSIVISSIKTAKGIRANPQSAISNQKSYA
jgi:predicted FMN-binding regulatory protein PaiB